jgi:hypothetical protein
LQVTEEAVLNDTAGLHLGGGPFMLFYSRVSHSRTEMAAEASLLDSQSPTQELHGLPEQVSQATQQPQDPRPPSPQESQRDYETRKEEFSKWHPFIRMEVRKLNAQFRAALEEAGVVDPEGRILQTSATENEKVSRAEGDNGNTSMPEEKYMWEDTLARWEDEEFEETIQYDSDPQEVLHQGDEGENERLGGDEDEDNDKILGGPWNTRPSAIIQPYQNSATVQNTPLDWRFRSDGPKTWEDAETAAETGWGPGVMGTPIEVEVTQTVETEEKGEEPDLHVEK